MTAFAQMLEVALGATPEASGQAPFEASLRAFEQALAAVPGRATSSATIRIGSPRLASYGARVAGVRPVRSTYA